MARGPESIGPEFRIELFAAIMRELTATGDPRDAERAGLLGVMLESRGKDLIYHPQTAAGVVSAVDLFSRVYPEIPLSEEHQRQGLILAGRFAARLGMSEEAYIVTLPQFPERPSNYSALGLNVPVIVETRIPWMVAAELSGIYVTDYLKGRADAGKVSDWQDDGFKMPQVPFSAWAQDGTEFVCRKPNDVRKELLGKGNENYRAGRILDGITIWNVRPDLVKTMFWDVIGTRVGSDCMPCLSHWDDRPGLGVGHVDDADPSGRVLVLGREIRTLDLVA